MLRALASGPLSLTELDGIIGSLSYPSMERRLAAMRLAGQLEARPNHGRGTPYAVTDWTREGMAPIIAAAHWEQRHMSEMAAPLGRIDIETTFLLSMRLLVDLPVKLTGAARLVAEIAGRERRLAGVTVVVDDGAVGSCTTRLQDEVDTWALGSAAAWLAALAEGDANRLELGGNRDLAATLVESLNGALFGVPDENRMRT
jgi:DNA-binding HxlR family transcriptional regulator